jgi:hypothetical protein
MPKTHPPGSGLGLCRATGPQPPPPPAEFRTSGKNEGRLTGTASSSA